MAEKFWEDEKDPSELRRRAEALNRDCLFALAAQLNDRADFLDGRGRFAQKEN